MSKPILIDVPVIAYKRWAIGYVVTDDKGKRLEDEERKLNENLRRTLGNQYPYSPDRPHI